MKTSEKNKVIANFMGQEILEGKKYAEFVGCPEDELENMPRNNLLYHRSWNWLIPVAQKIINEYHTYVFFGATKVIKAGGEFDMKKLHEAVVNFIIKINEHEG